VLDRLAVELNGEGVLPGIDALEDWASGISGMESGDGELRYERIGHFQDGRDLFGLSLFEEGELIGTTFEQLEVIVVDVSELDAIEVVDENRVTLPPESPEESDEFHWRMYVGRGTLVGEGESTFRDSPDGKPRANVGLIPGPGVLIGRVGRWVGRLMSRPKKPDSDKFRGSRLKYFVDKHPNVARRYPDITDATISSTAPVMKNGGSIAIMVHGTFSCSIPAMVLLDRHLAVPAFRFEHDTFAPLARNASDLVHAVHTAIPQGLSIYFLAHSRGGLVARLAARDLATRYRVSVYTFGTPHRGTPLANAGGRMLNALLSMGRLLAGGVFSWDPISYSIKRLLRSRGLPDGLDIMRTDSQFLDSMRFGTDPFELRAYGGVYDLETRADGALAYIGSEFLKGVFANEVNDLVVPLRSTLASGVTRQLSMSCDHFSYFGDTEVLRDLELIR